MPSRRVLHVLHRAALAGTERHVLALTQGLKMRGWEPLVAVSRSGPAEAAFERAGIPVVHLRRTRGPDPTYVFRLVSLLKEREIDILHAHSGRLPCLAGRIAGIALVVETRHGLGSEGLAGARLRAQAFLCRLAKRTIAVCEADREVLIRGGLPPSRVVRISNGIPPRRRPPSERGGGTLRLGFLGRLAPQKDPLFLIDVVRHLKGAMPGGWTLRIAGDGPLAKRLREGLADGCPAGSLVWMGEIDHAEDFLDELDLLLFPSRWEGQPLAVLEAMQAGVVVLGSQIAALDELLGGEPPAGLLLRREPASWASAIMDLSRDRDRLRSMEIESMRRVAAEHGIGTMVERVERLYLDAFAGESACC
ncbi:MAG: glycosyltransferase family 4 protein [Candidatus Eisenbacteria bacterium]|nr:glycosyltransferase family 4 protein [Candidatus Eisenbacteria bacterium]